MKREIAVCHSILSHCFKNVNPLDQQNTALAILAEIDRNMVLMNDDIEVAYDIFFEENHPNLLADYQMWLSNKVQYANTAKIVSSHLTSSSISSLTSDDYLDILLNLTLIGTDKIVFSDLLTNLDIGLSALGILQMNQQRILNKVENNSYNSYRFPIIRKRIQNGESSVDLSNWLSKIIKDEMNITIIDPYIYANRQNLKTLFLNHVAPNATIKIYTTLNRNTRIGSVRRTLTNADLSTEFSHADYSTWTMEVYTMPQGEQHARNILTNQYYIHLEKGLAIFKDGVHTAQSDITIGFIDNITDNSMPAATRIL